MTMISSIFLGASTVLCLLYAYMLIFNIDGMIKGYGASYNLDSEVGGFAKRMAQYLGVAMFVFAFVFGHMRRQRDHAAAVHTAVMLYALNFAVAAYAVFLDPASSEKVKTVGMKNVYLMGGFLAFGVFSVYTLTLPAKEHTN